ncbi:MAG TPA: hypothetical protein VGV61_03135, partial [Thermoanaerobaculia bacterium]|nr:hypothetical protein [Thermoanaerobaculia bacterium]
EGVDRQVYAFTADYPTRVGETRLAAGDDVRVVGTSTGHVQELRKQIGSWHLEHCLGELFYRLPHPGEAFTLGADNLAAATGEVPAMPRPRVLVPKLASSPGRVTVTVVLENPSSEGSDIGQVDSNYIELWAVGGAFGDVRPGQFFRYDLLAPGPGGKLVRARVPTVLRFFVPVLRAGARIESGPIEVRTVREGLRDLQVRASFLASYGGTADIPTTSWEVLQPPPPPTPPPTPTPTPRSRRK